MADEDVELDDAPDVSFEARTDDGRRLTNMLASICLNTRQREATTNTLAWCEVTDHGMTFTVGVAKSLQAIAYVKREGVFSAWWLAEEHRGDHQDEKLEFGINLATLLECLRIFGGASVGGTGGAPDSKAQLHINFKPADACLNLSLIEGCASFITVLCITHCTHMRAYMRAHVPIPILCSCAPARPTCARSHSVTECEIHTLDIDCPNKMSLNLRDGERIPARIVIASDSLKSGIDELEWGGDNNRDKRVLLRVHPRPTGALSLTSSSTDVGAEMVWPFDALQHFEATHELAFEYRFLHVHMALKSLKDSHQCQLQIDAYGTLEIKMRFTAAAPKGSELFSHFFLNPLLEEDDIEEELGTNVAASHVPASVADAAWD